MTQRRNSELEHKRAIDDPDAVLRDLLKIPDMAMGTMAWAMLNGLPIGRAIPGGDPFGYGLDGQTFEHAVGPPTYPAVSEMFRT
ncbi:hypothetical protein [Paenarthrobacter sp. NPDC057981]|uniref:hypothetical protein n=1 Tax=Paenarthrobacter sp. NPDC057981 TaxID=3346297 RepID=UPI0036DCDB0D